MQCTAEVLDCNQYYLICLFCHLHRSLTLVCGEAVVKPLIVYLHIHITYLFAFQY
jgi:hypothetical protein